MYGQRGDFRLQSGQEPIYAGNQLVDCRAEIRVFEFNKVCVPPGAIDQKEITLADAFSQDTAINLIHGNQVG